MKSNKFIGMVQPKNKNNENSLVPELYKIGCMGKITSFKDTNNGHFLIELKGLIRFQILKEIKSEKNTVNVRLTSKNLMMI